jgi:hypothetical protein
MKLLSNFTDYYDHHFDLDGPTFDRRNNIGLNRKEMFLFFHTLGLRSPYCGTLKQVFDYQENRFPNVMNAKFLKNAVVYLDLNSHQGDNKLHIKGDTPNWEKYRDYFAVEFIPTSPYPSQAISYRYLQIGKRNWLLKYSSKEDWRSSVNPEITILKEGEPGERPKISYPLYAIDFLQSGSLFAVDFNQSPQIKGTGLEDILTPQDVVNLIKESDYAKTNS